MSVAQLKQTVQESSVAPSRVAVEAPQGGPLVKLLTCGSVDDGKSTLIGRLLWDAAGVTEDQRAAVTLASHNRAVNGERIDFSLLLDGLQAEREQGITIDIAWRYFETPGRRFIIIDSPGHEQYTRNMATGASHADIAILLVATPRSAISSASSAWCSRSTRWTKSTGRRRATGRSRLSSTPWPGASRSRRRPSFRWPP
jgi:bifunctional enzyme CysN/CysC